MKRKIFPFLVVVIAFSNARSQVTCQLTCPDNIFTTTGPNSTQCGTNVQFTVTSSCGLFVASVDQNQTPVSSGNFFTVGTTTITSSDGQSQCSFTITVVDNTPPTITCPLPSTAFSDANCQATVPDFVSGAVVTDNCSTGEAIIISQSPAAGTLVGMGPTTVTLTATDEAGNQSSCQVTFKVVDGAPPSITCPANIVTGNDAGKCSAVVNFDLPTATDACGTIESVVAIPPSGSTFAVGTTVVTVTATDDSKNQAQCSFAVTVNDQTPPSLTCPDNITVDAPSGQCSATVNYTLPTASDNCSSFVVVSTPGPGNSFPVGTTNVNVTATDAAQNQTQCSFTVTVKDVTPPYLVCPPDIDVTLAAGQCSATVSYNTPTATDECGSTTVIASPASGSTFLPGPTTVNVTATDASGNTATCSFTVTVKDVTPPSFTQNLTVIPISLWPPDHKLKDVTLNYQATDDCGGTEGLTYAVNISSNEPINGTGDGDTSPDWMVIDAHHIKLRAERGNGKDARVYTITVTVTDAWGNQTTSQVAEVRVTHNITGPPSGNPFLVGSTVNFSGVFWDKPGNKHTATWSIDDNATLKGTITAEPSGIKNGKVTGSYKFTNTGIYRVQMNVTDQNKLTSFANTNDDLEEIVVIYDPNGGYTYGGGWFNSPAGALTADKTIRGKVSYGFSVNYYKGATLPKGETQFEFKVGNLQYDALNFDYLSISGYKAVFAGSGKIVGGQSGVSFIMSVIDGALDETGINKIRIKIFNKNTGLIYYDNQPGASDAANPSTPVGSNSTVVIQSTNITTAYKERVTEEPTQPFKEVHVTITPNPSCNNFTLRSSSSTKDDLRLEVVDQSGRIIESRMLPTNSKTIIGDDYRPGLYIIRVIQQTKSRAFKLVKLQN